MIKLIVSGTQILGAGAFVDQPDRFSSPDVDILKLAFPGAEMVSVDVLPPGFAVDRYEWIDGALSEKPPIAPPPVVPESVSRFQARMALRNAGLFDAADAAMNDPSTPVIAMEAWQTAQIFRRSSPTVAAMAAALGLTDQQLDELFVAAGQIEA